MIDLLTANNRNDMPWKIDASDIKFLLDKFTEKGFTVSTRRGYMAAIRKWTTHYGNNIVKDMKIRWPADMRPNADWLTTHQAEKLITLPKSPMQELIVHCELCLGMRRIEVLRLKPNSFSGTYVDVLGKGMQGGKPRRVPYHRDTENVLRRYVNYRDALINLARSQFPVSTKVPETLLMWSRGNRLYEYSKKGVSIDAQLKSLGPDIGYRDISNHTLRRTFGREMYRSLSKESGDLCLPVIAKIMGHDSLEQCMKYLGLDMDDMTRAMNKFALGMG